MYIQQFDNLRFDSIQPYHPYRQGNNPKFDGWSSRILDLKRNREEAIAFFMHATIKYIQANLDFDFSVITYVPSHDANKISMSGIARVAQKVATIYNCNFVICLNRVNTITRLSHGGNRSLGVHFNSLQVINQHLIARQKVLLLDDVTTTGNSFKACKMLLEQAGALDVYCLAMGKTQRYHD